MTGYANAAQPILNQLSGLANQAGLTPMQAWNTAAAQANPTPAHQNWLNQNQARNMLGQGWYQQASAAQQQHHMAALHQQQMAAMQRSMANHKEDWMVNGKRMTFEQFLDEVCPAEDDPVRTFLILKYKK